MDTYTLYWKDGLKEVVEGNTIGEALTTSVRAHTEHHLDFFSCEECNDYQFNSEEKSWKNIRISCPVILSNLESRSAGLHMTGGLSPL